MVRLTIPYPPSANRLWRSFAGRVIKSLEYRMWLSTAMVEILGQRPKTISGKYVLIIMATPPDRRARDLDNLVKPISDALAAAKVIQNDSQAKRLIVEWTDDPPTPGGRVEVLIHPAQPNRAVA